MEKGKSKRTLTAIIVCIVLFLYYVLFMRRGFVRSDARLPYFWDPILNQTLRRYVDTLPSRQVLFVTGGTGTGKSRAMDIIADKLTHDGKLAIVLDGENSADTEKFVRHIKRQILKALIAIRRYLPSDIVKQLQGNSGLSRRSPLPGLDPSLSHFYGVLTSPIDESLCENGTVKMAKVWEFLDTLNGYHELIHPVLFVHAADRMWDTPFFEAVRGPLSRKNLYESYVPVVAEMKNSKNLLDLGTSNVVKIVATANALNESAQDFLIRSRMYSSYEVRKVNNNFGPHGGVIAEVYEHLKFDVKIDQAIDLLNSFYERRAAELIPKGIRKPASLYALCKTGDALIVDKNDAEMLSGLFEQGYVYNDASLHTRFAHKGLAKAFCSR